MQNLVCIRGIESTFFLGLSFTNDDADLCVCAGVCMGGAWGGVSVHISDCSGMMDRGQFICLFDDLTQGLKHAGQALPLSCPLHLGSAF